MDAIPSDTTVEAARKQFEILRRLDMNARANMTFQLSDNLRKTVEAGVRQRHPDWQEQEVERKVLHLMIGDQIFRRIFRDSGARR